jgi:pimeloyl-ACP methyl ester carboxylesterase
MVAPTVVLVHGAFADASSFANVTSLLLAADIDVVAPGVPMRSLLADGAYVASVIEQIDGPVVLVGHSYGGAVITIAGTVDNVAALVYLAGYALAEGESLSELQGGFPDSDLIAALVQKSFPREGSPEPGVDITVDVEKFPAIVGADVDQDLMKVLAVSQRPLAATAFTEPAPAAAWKTKPSWGVVSSSDHTINPDVERFGYKRADMTVEEINSSHMVILSHPTEVADLIKRVIAATTP